jgi:hypothetical protein
MFLDLHRRSPIAFTANRLSSKFFSDSLITICENHSAEALNLRNSGDELGFTLPESHFTHHRQIQHTCG